MIYRILISIFLSLLCSNIKCQDSTVKYRLLKTLRNKNKFSLIQEKKIIKIEKSISKEITKKLLLFLSNPNNFYQDDLISSCAISTSKVLKVVSCSNKIFFITYSDICNELILSEQSFESIKLKISLTPVGIDNFRICFHTICEFK